MKYRYPILQFSLVILILIGLIGVGVPDTVSANLGPIVEYQLSSEEENSPGIISAREEGIVTTASSQYWSSSRMQAAQPYPLPDIDPPSLSGPISTETTSEPGYIPGVPPATGSAARSAESETILLPASPTNGYQYPPPYTRYENFDSYQVYPYSTVGVLFFSQRGSDYRCSAAVVGKNALWTAGHCVHDGSGEPAGWSENVVFVPAYKNGVEPFGRWEYVDLVTRWSWFSNADLRYDIGGVILKTNGSGKPVEEVVGRLGFAFNLDKVQHWFNFGYPSDPPFDGKTMQICAGSFARNAIGSTAPIPVGMGCDMTGGSSGGPWVINFSGAHGDSNLLNGNNSFRYTVDDEDEIYSPYFGQSALDLLLYIAQDSEALFPIIISTIGQ